MVIDTMVFAYALLETEDTGDEALEVLQRAKNIIVPDSIRAELVNVVWKWIREDEIAVDDGVEVLREAEALFTHVVPSSAIWERALRLSAEVDHPAYDTLFVAIAEHERTKVITYDRAMRRAFPDLTLSPTEFLGKNS
jgi:predicted nucleic acid-binding protein